MSTTRWRFRVLVLASLWLLAACSVVPQRQVSPPPVADDAPVIAQPAPPSPPPPAAPRLSEAPDLWTRFAAARTLRACEPADRVSYWMHRYAGHRERFAAQLAEMMPRMDYVLRRAEALGLPGEVMLVPYIESHYRTDARGAGGAFGMWQLMPDTASRFGLSRTRDGLDERADLVRSTDAALRLLAHHRDDFSGHAKLMFAAYNAGGYRVRKLLAGREAESVTAADLHTLALPRTTREYLTKLQALSCLIGEASRFDVVLPVDDRGQHLAEWRSPVAIDPRQLAGALALDAEALQRSNRCAFERGHLAAGGVLLVPEVAVPALDALMSQGELAGLAARQSPAVTVATAADVHRVRRGDSLWDIARRYRLGLGDLMRWNRLTERSVLRVGQELRLAEP